MHMKCDNANVKTFLRSQQVFVTLFKIYYGRQGLNYFTIASRNFIHISLAFPSGNFPHM